MNTHACTHSALEFDRQQAARMSGRPLVVFLAFCCWCHYWAAAGSAVTCEAVGRDVALANASCRRVTSDCGDKEHNDELRKCFTDEINIDLDPIVRTDPYQLKFAGLENFRDTGTIGYCPQSPSYNNGGCIEQAAAGSTGTGLENRDLELSYNFQPFNFNHFNLSVSWSFPDGKQPSNRVEAYSLVLTGLGVIADPGYCVCINSSLNLTEHTFTMSYYHGDHFITAQVFTFPLVPSETYTIPKKRFKSPRHCADYKTGLLYDTATCGLPRYGKPTSVTLERNDTHTHLSWDKPCYENPDTACSLQGGEPPLDTDPAAYYLTTITGDGSSYFVIQNTTEVVVNTTEEFDFLLHAYIPCSGLFEYFSVSEGLGNGCSIPASMAVTEPAIPCCTTYKPPTPVPTPTPTLSAPSQTSHAHYVVVYALSGVAVVVILIAIVVFILLAIRHKWRKIYDPVAKFADCSALVIHAPRTPETQALVIRQNLVADLRNPPYGVESSIPELSQPRQNMIDWITEQHERASAVFCVCNQQLFEDWNELSVDDHNPPVVHTLKLLFQADMRQGSKGTDKYAVVLTDRRDDKYIPSLLKDQQRFLVSDSAALAEFAASKPIPGSRLKV